MLLTIISVSSIYPTINIRIEPTKTIIQLKEEIKKKINIIIERQRLIFAGRLLQNEETCKLLADSTCIHLLIIDETKYWKDKIDTLITERQEAAQQETKYMKDKIDTLITEQQEIKQQIAERQEAAQQETKYWKDKIDTLITAKQRRRKAERQEAAQQETKYMKIDWKDLLPI